MDSGLFQLSFDKSIEKVNEKLDTILNIVSAKEMEKDLETSGFVTDARITDFIKFLYNSEGMSKVDCVRYYRILYNCGIKDGLRSVEKILFG